MHSQEICQKDSRQRQTGQNKFNGSRFFGCAILFAQPEECEKRKSASDRGTNGNIVFCSILLT